MAALSATSLSSVGANTTPSSTLTASDTFTYSSNSNQILVLRNGTGGALTVNLLGNAATTVAVPGYGNVTVSAGYSTGSIAAGATVTIALNTIAAYLSGTSVTVTGGTGISATLYQL
jgi:hypothetical protein